MCAFLTFQTYFPSTLFCLHKSQTRVMALSRTRRIMSSPLGAFLSERPAKASSANHGIRPPWHKALAAQWCRAHLPGRRPFRLHVETYMLRQEMFCGELPGRLNARGRTIWSKVAEETSSVRVWSTQKASTTQRVRHPKCHS